MKVSVLLITCFIKQKIKLNLLVEICNNFCLKKEILKSSTKALNFNNIL